jgi:hypothetical protein
MEIQLSLISMSLFIEPLEHPNSYSAPLTHRHQGRCNNLRWVEVCTTTFMTPLAAMIVQIGLIQIIVSL